MVFGPDVAVDNELGLVRTASSMQPCRSTPPHCEFMCWLPLKVTRVLLVALSQVFFVTSDNGGWVSCYTTPGSSSVCADFSSILIYMAAGITVDSDAQLIYIMEEYDAFDSNFLIIPYSAGAVKVRCGHFCPMVVVGKLLWPSQGVAVLSASPPFLLFLLRGRQRVYPTIGGGATTDGLGALALYCSKPPCTNTMFAGYRDATPVAASLSPVDATSDWANFGHDLRHTSVANVPGPVVDSKVAWTFESSMLINSSPTVHGDVVFVGSDGMHALNATTGA